MSQSPHKRESEKRVVDSKKFLFAFACLLVLLLIYVDAMHHVDTYRVSVAMPLLLEIAKIMEVSILSCLGVYGVAQGLEKWNERGVFARGIPPAISHCRLDPKDFDHPNIP